MSVARPGGGDLERLAGGALWVGFPGDSLDAAPLAALRDMQPGGLIAFDCNVTTPERTRDLFDGLRAELSGAGPPPLVAVDQEGSRVARLRRGVPQFPAALAVGAAGDERLAERVGLALATLVRAAGIDVNFAPVLDLALEGRSTAIGTRAFGDDPGAVARLGAAVVRGLQRGGVASVIKHFPGHGGTPLDSHLTLPAIDADRATLELRDLAPFRAGIAAGALGVMVGHLLVPAFDAERAASLSEATIEGVLRGALGFEGIVFSDCLEMHAVARTVGSVRAAVLALASGADALAISRDLALAKAVRDALVDAVRTGEVSAARLEAASARRERLRVAIAALPGERDGDPAATARALAEAAIVSVRGAPALAPGLVTNVVSFEADESPPLHVMLRERRIRAEMMRVPLDPSPDAIDTLADVLSGQSGRQLVVVTRRAHLHEAQARTVERLLAAYPDAVLVSAREPYDVTCFPTAHRVLATFGDEPPMVEALADVLAGRRVPRGRLPVHLQEAVA